MADERTAGSAFGKPSIQAIIFDLGNVLVPVDYSRALEKLVPEEGPFREDVLKLFRADPIHNEYESGSITTDEFLNRYRRKYIDICGMDIDREKMADAFRDIFTVFVLTSACNAQFR